LYGADLNGAHLQGAYLVGAHLEGAYLPGANLRGADLNGAQLQGAYLFSADLRGSNLRADLKGADLTEADLRGADLTAADLQGASLNGARLQGAWIAAAAVWRADARKANWKEALVINPTTEPAQRELGEIAWNHYHFMELKTRISKNIPEGDRRRDALKRIEPKLNPDIALEGEKEMERVWIAREDSNPSREGFQRLLAEQWRIIGCDANGAHFALKQMLNSVFSRDSEGMWQDDTKELPKLAATFLDAEHCPGARGLSETEVARLKRLAVEAKNTLHAPKR